MAVGGSFFVVLLHYISNRDNNQRLNELALRILKIFFMVTTSFGALTGVGIWFVTATVSPASIASLLHVFFWVWFTEWIIFVTEVVLIMFYYLGWKKYGPKTGFRFGIAYVVVSWLTMVAITGILSAMLTPGKWISAQTLATGYFNPGFVPQLFMRTSMAAILSVCFGLFVTRISPKYKDQWETVWKVAGKSLLILSPFFLFAVFSYYNMLPEQISHLIATALMTMKYSAYAYFSKIFFVFTVLFLIICGLILMLKKKDYVFISIVPALLMIFAVGNIERVREFIRKPYTIHNYLYSNGIREAEAPFLNKNGILEFTGWAARSAKETDPELKNGEMIFKVECSICHTYSGINGITKKTNILIDKDIIANFLKSYKRSHPFMPQFVGTDEERTALAAYLDKIVHQANPTQEMAEPKPVEGD